MTLYLESSAALAWLLDEAAGRRVAILIAPPSRLVCSVVTMLEAGRTIARLETAGTLSPSVSSILRARVDALASEAAMFQVSSDIVRRAALPFPAEPVRSLDAIHLATMIEARPVHHDLSVLTLDRRILANLAPLGLRSAL